MFDLITIGDSTFDTFLIIDDATLTCDLKREHCQLCFTYADKIPITGTSQSIGGNAPNVAVGAQRLGLSTAIVTELGDDSNGEAIERVLAQADVDRTLVRQERKAVTRYSIVLNYQGERTILAYHAKRRYRLPALPEARAMYYTSLGKTFERLQAQLLKQLTKRRETILAVNPGSYQIKDGLKHFKEVLPRTDILFVNKEEAIRLVGRTKEVPALIRSLHKAGPKIVVVTDSLNGSHASDGSAIYFMPVYPAKAVSKTGAGDAYASGFMAAILKDKTVPEAMRWGTANAAGVVQKWGAEQGLLTERGIKRLLFRYPKPIPTQVG